MTITITIMINKAQLNMPSVKVLNKERTMNKEFAIEFKKALEMQKKIKEVVGDEFYTTKLYKEIRAEYKRSMV